MSGRYNRLVSLFLIFAAFGFSTAGNYCNIETCRTRYNQLIHTMCAYTSSNPGRACSNVISRDLTQEEKNQILYLHNALRQKVASGRESRGLYGRGQPAAANMLNLEWDNEIAMIAQRWANQCIYDHDKCRDIQNYQVGQSVGRLSTSEGADDPYLSIETIVMNWYNEVRYFDSSELDAYRWNRNVRGQYIGHYTQMVWADTTKIGCGKMLYQNTWITWLHVVCNYGPAGNTVTYPVYQRV